MKYITVKISEIAKDPTMRLDARYWIQKSLLKKRKEEIKNDDTNKINKRKVNFKP